MNAEYWLRQAYRAATNSPDMSNQNGAVLVSQRTEKKVGKSFNHFNGVKAELEDRDKKLARITHAEEGAIFSAWGAVGPLVMYCPWASCFGCARDIINCGQITKLVVHEERMAQTPDRWRHDIAEAHLMLKEAKIEIEVFRGTIPDSQIIQVNGQPWSPETLRFES